MCVTRSKEKVGKYAPVRMYACVHYKKRKATLRSYQNKDCDDDEIEDKNRRKLITVNNDCRK